MPIRVVLRTDIPMIAGPPGDVPLAIPRVEQTQTNWCWAACAEMVLSYFGKTGLAQCDFASFLFSEPSCCTTPSSSTCDSRCEYADVSVVYANWGVQSSLVRSAVTFDTLSRELAALRPVEVGVIWNGGGGHLMVVVQASDSTGESLVVIRNPRADPQPGDNHGILLYSELLTVKGYGIWDATWTGIEIGS